MAILKLRISTGRPASYYNQNFESGIGKHSIANRLAAFIVSVATGTEKAMSTSIPPRIVISVQENEVAAFATLTIVSAIATDTVVINGVSFAAVNSAPTGNQWIRSASDTTSAVNLAAAINASATALVSGYVIATSALGVVTVTSVFYGIAGNMTTLTTTGGTITASSARLVSGVVDATTRTLSF